MPFSYLSPTYSRHNPDSISILESLVLKLGTFPKGKIDLGGKYSKEYFELLAEYDYEMLSQFDTEPVFEIDSDIIDDITPQLAPIDYLIGPPPKYPDEYCPL